MTLFPLLLVGVLAAVVACCAALVRRTPPSREAAVAAARRHATLTAAVALVAAALAGLGTAVSGIDLFHGEGDLGRTVMLAPIVAGVVHTAVLVLGELTWPRPQGDVRRARLTRRGLLDAAPRWLVRLAVGTLAALVAVLAAGAVTADHTRRGFSVSWPDGATSAGPYPGPFYAVPAAVGLAVLVSATAAALRVVADRPAVATEDPRVEAALRRASAHRVLRGATAGALALLAGLLSAAGSTLHSVGSSGFPGSAGYAVAGWVVGTAALVTGLLAVVVACVRAPVVPADVAVPTA